LTGTSYAVRNGSINAELTGAGALAKTTGGTVTINAAQTYTGGTTVTAGTLATGAPNVLPAGQAVVVTGGGTLDIGAHNQSIGALQVGVSASAGASSGNVTGTSGVLTATSYDFQQGTISAALGGTAPLIKGNSGSGNHNGTISGANTYTGGTIINSGTLLVGAHNSLPVGGDVTLTNATSEARLDVGQFNQNIGVLTVNVTNAGDNAVRSSTGVISATSVELMNGQIPALLGGSTTVNKTTGGAARLGGTGTVNTYTGNTNLNEGTLTIASNAHLGAPSSTLVFNGGTLRTAAAFTGTRSVTVNAGGASFDTNNFDIQFGDVSGTGNVTKNSTGKLTFNHIRTSGDVNVNTGTVAVMPDSTSAGTSNIGSLNIASGSTFDLTANKLITTTAPGTATGGIYDGVQGQVQLAYNFGGWDLPGLKTSELLAGPNAGPLSGTTTIGVATAEQVLFLGPTDTGVFSGQTVTGASTIAMYTYAGDVNFDGLVDAADYGVIDNWVQFPGTDGYANGDLNYDGVIDAADYGIIDNTIQLQGAPFPGVNDGAFASGASSAGLAGVTAVPEPTACGLALVAAAGLLGRRRRRCQQ
jgi:autotransporter-associated beta strand protein